jgi:hypothetical protein
MILNNIQHQVLIGGLLGDSCLEMGNKSKNARLKIERQLLDKNYLEWQYSIFKNLCSAGIKEYNRFDKRYNKYYNSCYFKTKTSELLTAYYNKWYINKIKCIPNDIELTSLVLAIYHLL